MEKFKSEFIEKVKTLVLRFIPSASDDVALFIACQFALESDFGRSVLARDNSNYCGMCIPSARLTAGVIMSYNSHAGFMQYDSLETCVLDYIYRCLWYKFTPTDFSRVEFFKLALRNSGYCPEKDYISRIEKIYNQFINLNN